MLQIHPNNNDVIGKMTLGFCKSIYRYRLQSNDIERMSATFTFCTWNYGCTQYFGGVVVDARQGELWQFTGGAIFCMLG